MMEGQKQQQKNLSSHRRAATLSLAWSKPDELKNQVASEVTIFKEALERMKQTVNELSSEKQAKSDDLEKKAEALQVLEAMVADMKDHLSATEEELKQRDVVIADLNAELEVYKRKAAGANAGADAEKSSSEPAPQQKKKLLKEGTTIGEWLGEYAEIPDTIDPDLVAKIKHGEARRFGIMMCAMQLSSGVFIRRRASEENC